MTETQTDNFAPPSWVYGWLAAAVAFAALGVWVTFSAWAEIYDIVLNDEEASHIWLVPIIVGWLLLAGREKLQGYRPRVDATGAVMILVGWAVSTYGFYSQVQSFFHGGALLLVVGCFLTVMGAGLIVRLPAVFFALLFLIPVPGMIRQEIAIPLQTQTAVVTQFIFDLFAVPVQRSGNLLSYNGVDVTIAEACNGMRMVFTLVSVCYVFAFATSLRSWVRVLILLLSPLVALVCNVLRVIPTIYVYGHYSESAASMFHDLSGWVMIFLSFILLMGFVNLLDWLQVPIRPEPTKREDLPRSRAAWVKAPIVLTLVLAALAMSAAIVEGATRPKPADAADYHKHIAAIAAEMPHSFGDWQGQSVAVPSAAIKLLKPNVIISMAYENEKTDEKVSFLLVQCKKARDLAGHYPPICYAGIGWVGDGEEKQTWNLGDHTVPGMEYLFVRGSGAKEYRMAIANLLVMPDGEYLRDIKGVYNAAADYTVHFFGAAQVQIVFPAAMLPQRRHEITTEFLNAYQPLLEAMADAPIEVESPLRDE